MPITPSQFQEMVLRVEKNRGLETKEAAASDAEACEQDLHERIIRYCKDQGWAYFHGSMAHRAMRTIGEPDFTIVADRGRVFFVEAKSAIGKLRPEQRALQAWMVKLGHSLHVVRSMREFLRLVEPIESPTPNNQRGAK